MTRFMLFLALICMASVFLEGGSFAEGEGWKSTSACKAQSLGKSDAASADSVFTYDIISWKPTVKYVFHGELSWDSSMRSAQGRIFLKKKGTSLNQRIADWSNPPSDANIEQDVTRYIDGNGVYYIEWHYLDGVGVCIMKSEINPSE